MAWSLAVYWNENEEFLVEGADARSKVAELTPQHKWPVYFFASDTTGEKDFEEFYTDREKLDMDRFSNIGVIKNGTEFDAARIEHFVSVIAAMRKRGSWKHGESVELFNETIP